jgi:hypothetical protein
MRSAWNISIAAIRGAHEGVRLSKILNYWRAEEDGAQSY